MSSVLELGAFERAAPRGRRGFGGTGLAGTFGQNPAQRRALAPFGNPNMLGGTKGRSDFTGGILGGALGERSAFGGGGSSALDFGGLFDGLSWDPATGLRQKGGLPGTGTGAPGGLSANGATPYDQAFIDAAREMSAKYGVNLDPALVKAMAHIESGGTFGMPIRGSDGSDSNPAVGMMQVKPAYWGGLANEIGADIYDPVGNIRTGAAIMAQGIRQYGTWEAALTNIYFPADDVNGTTQGRYIDQARTYMQQYSDGSGGIAGGGRPNTGTNPGGGGWGSATGNAVVDLATQYVGVRYDWASIPGASEDPWATGWDCSGMIKWLSDKMGGGVPAGSHYQYQWAQQTGRLTMDASSLKPGDLVFMDTGGRAGGGANHNGASHVGMYIGNGQMIHAANESVGTIISSMSDPYYSGRFIGGARMDWSGGSGYTGGASGGAPAQPQGIQAVNGAYYSSGYTIPTRWRR